LLVEIQISTITMENSMEVHKNSKARTTIWSSDTTPLYIPKGIKINICGNTCTPCF
jgi:hypothetical protein